MMIPQLIKWYSRFVSGRLERQIRQAPELQRRLLGRLTAAAAHTRFGKAHGFAAIRTPEDLRDAVPVMHYADYQPYVEQIAASATDVTWKGRPAYWAVSSGTTGGRKYLPVSREALRCQFRGRMLYAANFTARLGLHAVHEGRWIIFADSPVFFDYGGIPAGALSSILTHEKPGWLARRNYPSAAVNDIEAYEDKIRATAREVVGQDIRGITGTPPLLMLLVKAVESETGKPFRSAFPRLVLVSTSGMRLEPYEALLRGMMPPGTAFLQSYPASEGYFGFQYERDRPDILLLPDNGVFYEFVRADEIAAPRPRRYWLGEVCLGVPYVMVISTNAGLWCYNLGDLVEFTSLDPPLVRILGRAGQTLNVFGEHFTQQDVESALQAAVTDTGMAVRDFALRAVLPEGGGLPHHAWYVEWEASGAVDAEAFAARLDAHLCAGNMCYRDLVVGRAVGSARVVTLPGGSFRRWMIASGRAGTQYKTPRFLSDESAAALLAAAGGE